MNPFEFTKKLMAIPSVTGTEGEIAQFLALHLESLGYRVERQQITGDRFNLFAFAGEGRVMFCTHLDTVPPPTVPIREDDEFLTVNLSSPTGAHSPPQSQRVAKRPAMTPLRRSSRKPRSRRLMSALRIVTKRSTRWSSSASR